MKWKSFAYRKCLYNIVVVSLYILSSTSGLIHAQTLYCKIFLKKLRILNFYALWSVKNSDKPNCWPLRPHFNGRIICVNVFTMYELQWYKGNCYKTLHMYLRVGYICWGKNISANPNIYNQKNHKTAYLYYFLHFKSFKYTNFRIRKIS